MHKYTESFSIFPGPRTLNKILKSMTDIPKYWLNNWFYDWFIDWLELNRMLVILLTLYGGDFDEILVIHITGCKCKVGSQSIS